MRTRAVRHCSRAMSLCLSFQAGEFNGMKVPEPDDGEQRGPNRDGGQTMKANLASINAKGTLTVMRREEICLGRDTHWPK